MDVSYLFRLGDGHACCCSSCCGRNFHEGVYVAKRSLYRETQFQESASPSTLGGFVTTTLWACGGDAASPMVTSEIYPNTSHYVTKSNQHWSAKRQDTTDFSWAARRLSFIHCRLCHNTAATEYLRKYYGRTKRAGAPSTISLFPSFHHPWVQQVFIVGGEGALFSYYTHVEGEDAAKKSDTERAKNHRQREHCRIL